jgi:hypothetical protein
LPNKSNEKSTLGELDAFSDLKAMFDSAGVKDEKVKVEKKENVQVQQEIVKPK